MCECVLYGLRQKGKDVYMFNGHLHCVKCGKRVGR